MPFPKNFLFGSATSSHQIEGGNTNSDWYRFERISGHIANNETSLIACDSWNKYKDDVELLKQTHQNAYRFSIEWAKIEPEEGRWDQKAINHYRDQLELLKKNNIKTMVTLFHFTLPLWIADRDGFANSENIKYFVRFARKMLREYGDLVDFWATLNEPNVYVLKGYVEGKWCPGEKNYLKAIHAWFNFIIAHNRAYAAMKKIDKNAQIGPVISTMSFVPAKINIINIFLVWFARQFSYDLFIRFVIKKSDFLGLNYYLKTTMGFMGFKKAPYKAEDEIKSDYGWGVHPEGIYQTSIEQSRWGKPIFITENGIADAADKLRPNFITENLDWLERAIKDGAPVKGYFYWSLLDNFEWAAGYAMKFGLHTIDRKPRPSAKRYAELIQKYLKNQSTD